MLLKSIIQIPIDHDLLERINAQAAAQGRPRAALIRAACTRYLRELEREKREREYEEGYRRIPDATTVEESLAWLSVSGIQPEAWPEAPKRSE